MATPPNKEEGLARVALTAFALGAAGGAALALAAWAAGRGGLAALTASPGRVAAYTACMAVFHFAEFYYTAVFHPEDASVHCKSRRRRRRPCTQRDLLTGAAAFLLDHSAGYGVATAAGVVEHALGALAGLRVAALHRSGGALAAALLMAAGGQLLRSRAMIDGGRAFTHHIAEVRRRDHRLVREGAFRYAVGAQPCRHSRHRPPVRRLMRHPSYAGFYLWAVGCQLVLGNVVCALAFALILHRFFSERIRAEEAILQRFFPGDYERYRRECPSGIPLVR